MNQRVAAAPEREGQAPLERGNGGAWPAGVEGYNKHSAHPSVASVGQGGGRVAGHQTVANRTTTPIHLHAGVHVAAVVPCAYPQGHVSVQTRTCAAALDRAPIVLGRRRCSNDS